MTCKKWGLVTPAQRERTMAGARQTLTVIEALPRKGARVAPGEPPPPKSTPAL